VDRRLRGHLERTPSRLKHAFKVARRDRQAICISRNATRVRRLLQRKSTERQDHSPARAGRADPAPADLAPRQRDGARLSDASSSRLCFSGNLEPASRSAASCSQLSAMKRCAHRIASSVVSAALQCACSASLRYVFASAADENSYGSLIVRPQIECERQWCTIHVTVSASWG
jgi:hypothetical protein